MSYCPKCGTNLPDNARFCGICGAQLAAPSYDGSSPYQQPQQQTYGDQYQQPQQSPYGSQYQQPYGNQYQQPAYGNQPQQPRQQAPGYSAYLQQPAYAGNTGRQKPVKAKKPARSPALLRILSLLFAIGLIILAAGIGGNIYFNRVFDEMTQVEEGELTSEERDLINEGLIAVVKKDAKAYKKAQKDVFVYGLKEMMSDRYSKNKTKIDTALNEYLSSVPDSEYRQALKEDYNANSSKYGIRWIMMIIGANASLLMIIGGALAGVALILWLILGGISAGLGKTWFLPFLLIAILLAAGIIVSCFLVAPIDDIISDAVTALGSKLDSSKLSDILY